MADTLIKYGEKTYKFDGPESDHIFSIVRHRSTFYELDLLEAVKALGLKGTYIDVGGNIGNHSLFFSTCCSSERLISIEPLPKAFSYLVKNVSEQATIPVDFLNCALSDSPGFCSMSIVNPNNLGMTRVEPGNTVTLRTLDSILENIDDASFIKIDVEGFEDKVLLGGLKTIERCHPILAVESATNEEFLVIKSLLEPLGYSAIGKYAYTPVYIWQYQK